MGTDLHLSAQHCLTIAAAFIAIIAACASLISSANSKAESLANRIRGATKEYRKQSGTGERCGQLREEISLFKNRFRRVQIAQRRLFLTIAILIVALTIFLLLGLFIIYFNTPDAEMNDLVRYPIASIWLCVAFSTLCMLSAIYYQYSEVGASFETLCIETRDCERSDDRDSATNAASQTVSHGFEGVAGATAESI